MLREIIISIVYPPYYPYSFLKRTSKETGFDEKKRGHALFVNIIEEVSPVTKGVIP